MNTHCVLLVSFTLFGFALLAQPSNDDFSNAIDISGLINTCSPDAAYTTINATSDLSPGSTWSTSPDYNVWFSFVAPASGMLTVTVDRGGAQGSLRRALVAIWENDGITEINSNTFVYIDDDVSTTALGLIPGNTYYISVDNDYSGYQGSFSLCLSDAADYDFYEGAIDVTALINTCSADAEYTTIGATGDKNAGSCWDTSPDYNRWFKFTAPASGMLTITVDRGGTKGSIQRAEVAVWESDGTTEVTCNRYVDINDDVATTALGMTPGNTYYISVDNNYSGYRGSFTLCLSDAADYDYYEGALDVTGLINACSADAEYTTIGATGDKNAGSCWNTSPDYNRWFKFTAPASGMLTITVDRGGTKGSIQRAEVAVWESDGTTEVTCNRYVDINDDVATTALGMTPGNTYYISVDNNYSGYRGTFTLCLSDAADYDYYEGAIDVTGFINTCSADAEYTTIGATGDKNTGSCWDTSPDYNRWFKFTAPASGMLTITVDRGGTKGSIQRAEVAVWESDGTTEVTCNRYVDINDDVATTALGMTPGNTYYISVDNNYSGYRGTFTLCLSDAADYDFYEGAILINDINNWCSADAEYTTIGATGDKNAASCWNTSPSYNRWFKFVATGNLVNVTAKRGGALGTVKRLNVALWENDGITEVACNIYVDNNDDVSLSSTALTPGNTYYISVDNNYSGNRGSFTLCVTDQADYDYYEGAVELTDLNNWCSADGAYTTVGATSDKNAGSCWNTSPNYNRWFKFTAVTADATIEVKRGGSLGTIKRINLALFESDGTTEVACQRYVSNNDNVSIATSALTVGNTYYISVDNNYGGYRGTFTLCIDNIDQVYYSINSGTWADSNNWSFSSHSGPSAGSYPAIGDVANIEGHTMTVSTAETMAEINLNAATNNTGLTISNGSLTVTGNVTISNLGNNINTTLTVSNGTLGVTGDFTLNRNGGTAIVSGTISNSTVNIGGDFSLNSTAGSGNNTIGISTLSNVTIGGQLNLNNTGGPKSSISVDNSNLTVDDDINFVAPGDNLVEISLSTGADLYLGNSIVRGTPAYGILSSSGNSVVHYNSGTNLQTMASTNGSGTGDVISYENVIINNSRITKPQVTLEGPVTIPGTLALLDGIVFSTSSNLLTLNAGATLSGGFANSFIDGPLKKIGNSDFTFQVGDGSKWAPLDVVNLSGDAATEFTTEYHFSPYSDLSNFRSPDPNGDLQSVSAVEYWTLDNTGTSSNADVTLHWKDQAESNISDFGNLVMAHYNTSASEWENFGKNSLSATDPGSITVTGVSSFSPFTFGSKNSPLPVELIDFKAEIDNEQVNLMWVTASELNNDRFEIERSADGKNFKHIGTVPGRGTTSKKNEYYFVDEIPIFGTSFYRLKQVDFDGTSRNSNTVSVNYESIGYYLYPNPVTDGKFDLRLKTGADGIVNLSIINTVGKEMIGLKEKFKPGIYKELNINVESIPSGIYLLKIDVDNISLTKRLIVK